MKVANAIKLLQELPPDAEICAQWYEKDDMAERDMPITDEVWELANAIFDRYEFSDMRYLLDDAIHEAKRRLEKKGA